MKKVLRVLLSVLICGCCKVHAGNGTVGNFSEEVLSELRGIFHQKQARIQFPDTEVFDEIRAAAATLDRNSTQTQDLKVTMIANCMKITTVYEELIPLLERLPHLATLTFSDKGGQLKMVADAFSLATGPYAGHTFSNVLTEHFPKVRVEFQGDEE